MPELEQQRLERLRSWASDFERLLANPAIAEDERAAASVKAMLDQCRKLIDEAEASTRA